MVLWRHHVFDLSILCEEGILLLSCRQFLVSYCSILLMCSLFFAVVSHSVNYNHTEPHQQV